MLRLAARASIVLVVAGCGGDPQPAPRPLQDPSIECVPEGADIGDRDAGRSLACAEGEVCVAWRCYTACRGAADCGPAEHCADGACRRRAAADAGIDAGPSRPCDGVECAPPLVCHPLSGTCVACAETTVGADPGDPGYCSAFAPICDIANGLCVQAGPSHCTPCNDDAACVAPDGTFAGRCARRDIMGIREEVCAAPCSQDGTCPLGLECDGAEGLCFPAVGVPCSNWRAAVERRSCLGDGDCAPLGSVAAIYVGACAGEVIPEDGGLPTRGVCLLACGATDDCWAVEAGQECRGAGLDLYCR